MSTAPANISPPATSWIKFASLFITLTAFSSSTLLSNLYEESLDKVNLLEVFLTFCELKFATSRRIFFVFSVICEFSPPITPPSATAFTPSEITISSLFNSLSCSSSVTSFSFSSPALTTIFPPSILSRSKAWLGWLSSIITKFEASTILLILLIPIDSTLSLSHFGLSLTVTFLIILATYLFAKLLSEISTEILSAVFSLLSVFITKLGYLTSFP